MVAILVVAIEADGREGVVVDALRRGILVAGGRAVRERGRRHDRQREKRQQR
jgi:hypothetical protein